MSKNGWTVYGMNWDWIKMDKSFYETIKFCRDCETIRKCKNANGKSPLVMQMTDDCKIMIVSQAPSLSASNKQILADVKNRTFNQFLDVLGITSDIFHKNIYWTHYGKCYPGKSKGGDQVPTVHCAEKYIETELKLCKPKMVIGISRPASRYLYSKFIDSNCSKSSLEFSSIINKQYFVNNTIWFFIKHTASTAKWSKEPDDELFIKNVLRPKVHEILGLD